MTKKKTKKVYVTFTIDQLKELTLDVVKVKSFISDIEELLGNAVYDAEKIKLGSSIAERKDAKK